MEGEFGEDEIAAVTADGVWVGRQGEELGAIGPFDFCAGAACLDERKVGGTFVVLVDAEFEDSRPILRFGKGFESLTFTGAGLIVLWQSHTLIPPLV